MSGPAFGVKARRNAQTAAELHRRLHPFLLAVARGRQRQVLELHWLEERSFPEVAAELGERLSAVKVRAHRAYRELRYAVSAAR